MFNELFHYDFFTWRDKKNWSLHDVMFTSKTCQFWVVECQQTWVSVGTMNSSRPCLVWCCWTALWNKTNCDKLRYLFAHCVYWLLTDINLTNTRPSHFTTCLLHPSMSFITYLYVRMQCSPAAGEAGQAGGWSWTWSCAISRGRSSSLASGRAGVARREPDNDPPVCGRVGGLYGCGGRVIVRSR